MKQEHVNVPLDCSDVDVLEQSNTSIVSTNYCPICIETEINTRYIKFPCDHVFHVNCFEKYLDYNMSHTPTKDNIECPICRKSFSTTTLRSVFYMSHQNTSENIEILVPSIDNNRYSCDIRGCRIADFLVIVLLFLGLTLYLLALYKRI